MRLFDTKHRRVGPNEMATVINFPLPWFHTETSVSRLTSTQPSSATLRTLHVGQDWKSHEKRVAGSCCLTFCSLIFLLFLNKLRQLLMLFIRKST